MDSILGGSQLAHKINGDLERNLNVKVELWSKITLLKNIFKKINTFSSYNFNYFYKFFWMTRNTEYNYEYLFWKKVYQ